MNRQKYHIDSISILHANDRAKDMIRHVRKLYEKYTNDPYKQERIEASECIVCFKSDRIGGAAMTNIPCGLCVKVMGFSSTNVDYICIDCARKNNLCKHCGADMELKDRRKLRPFQEEGTP